MKNQLSAVTQQQSPVVIGNISIHQDPEGRYCLNDLHKAAGGESRHQPGKWLSNKQTIELVDEYSKTGIPVIQQKQGLGTFVAKDLVYDYAMWISPAFKVKVIRTFDAVVTGQIQTAPVVQDPQTRALILLLTEQDAQKQELARQAVEQERQALQIEDVQKEVYAMKPRLTSSSLYTLQGAINHTARIYREAQKTRHIKVTTHESTEYIRLLVHDKFNVSDIGYLSDIKPACKFLQSEAKKHQTVLTEWDSRNSLFGGAR